MGLHHYEETCVKMTGKYVLHFYGTKPRESVKAVSLVQCLPRSSTENCVKNSSRMLAAKRCAEVRPTSVLLKRSNYNIIYCT